MTLKFHNLLLYKKLHEFLSSSKLRRDCWHKWSYVVGLWLYGVWSFTQLIPVHTSCECACEAQLTWIWRHNPPFTAIFACELSKVELLRIIRCEYVTSTFISHSHSQEVWTGLYCTHLLAIDWIQPVRPLWTGWDKAWNLILEKARPLSFCKGSLEFV